MEINAVAGYYITASIDAISEIRDFFLHCKEVRIVV